MKKYLTLLVFFFITCSTFAQINFNSRRQSSYYKPSTNRYVESHYKTNNNYTNHDNYSTKGNRNIYTEKPGYRAKDYSNDAYNYGSGKVIQSGSRGGQYYSNSRGNKVYVPKRY
jgi:uncharacterized protein YxeA